MIASHPSAMSSIILSNTAIPSFQQQRQQVRYHRTDYEGPGKFAERETGSMFGTGQHDHDHSHDDTHHVQQQQQVDVNEDEKEQIRQLLKARYTRRSGSYSHRGYTIGIGGPGRLFILRIFLFCKSTFLINTLPSSRVR